MSLMHANIADASWFIVGQLFASVALNELNKSEPYNYKTPIYTQVSEESVVTETVSM